MAKAPPPASLGRFSILRAVVARLRRECPWDREQDHRSLRANLLEECYEVLEAIDQGDSQRLCGELGDLLLQVLFQAQIAQDSGEFTLEEVVRGINQKLIRRHPHIFASARAETAQEVLNHWDKLKEEEGGSLLERVPRAMPALAHSQEVQSRAARMGFDWEETSGVLEKVAEEAAEVAQAASPAEREQEIGDLLFVLVNLARRLGVDAESALRQANQRFLCRFQYMEQAARRRGIRLNGLPLAELDRLWDEAKKQEKG